ncbi:hypothetical protein ANO11243_039160 [Dothideomycetidae sp. 11243]|nr:hypothetical protein ANO11243_039160 [fungal sp. No.11243]
MVSIAPNDSQGTVLGLPHDTWPIDYRSMVLALLDDNLLNDSWVMVLALLHNSWPSGFLSAAL